MSDNSVYLLATSLFYQKFLICSLENKPGNFNQINSIRNEWNASLSMFNTSII